MRLLPRPGIRCALCTGLFQRGEEWRGVAPNVGSGSGVAHLSCLQVATGPPPPTPKPPPPPRPDPNEEAMHSVVGHVITSFTLHDDEVYIRLADDVLIYISGDGLTIRTNQPGRDYDIIDVCDICGNGVFRIQQASFTVVEGHTRSTHRWCNDRQKEI